MITKPVICVVDDDAGMRQSLELLFRSVDLSVRSYSSAVQFLSEHCPAACDCLVLDLRMPGMDGLTLIGELRQRRIQVPVVILTAYAEVPNVVRSMKLGALDFLEKPADPDALLKSVAAAIEQGSTQQALRKRLGSLTPAERELLDLLILGRSNKQIALQLKRSIHTITNHRAHLMTKMSATNAADLVRMCMNAGLAAPH